MDELSYGIKLLADLVDWDKDKAIESLSHLNEYRFIPRKKKDGTIRKIYAPHKELKKLQRALLRQFLYKIPLLGICGQVIMGGMPRRGYVRNAMAHCKDEANFFLRLDLKNAFPTVTRKYLREILEKILIKEIKTIKGEPTDFSSTKSLFPWKRARWFRKMINKDDPNYEIVLGQFIDLLVNLTTYKGVMVQGIPTSPWLLNFVMTYSGVVDKLIDLLKKEQIIVEGLSRPLMTLYVDDFTISSTNSIGRYQINRLILAIERNSIFRINPKKTLYFNRYRTAPLITGLRLIEMPQHHSDLKTKTHLFIMKKIMDSLGIKQKDRGVIIKKRLKEPDLAIRLQPRLPKKQIRKIRGLIHSAIYDSALDSVVQGYLANLKPIYEKNLPNQIVSPYRKYMGQTYSRG